MQAALQACWKWCDGDGDNTAECYYFDKNGYVFTGAKTPDGYTVGHGAWTENGTVQTKLPKMLTATIGLTI